MGSEEWSLCVGQRMLARMWSGCGVPFLGFQVFILPKLLRAIKSNNHNRRVSESSPWRLIGSLCVCTIYLCIGKFKTEPNYR